MKKYTLTYIGENNAGFSKDFNKESSVYRMMDSILDSKSWLAVDHDFTNDGGNTIVYVCNDGRTRFIVSNNEAKMRA